MKIAGEPELTPFPCRARAGGFTSCTNPHAPQYGWTRQELLKPLTASDPLTGEYSDSASGSGALGKFASEAQAGALSQKGGFGIADRIVSELSHSGVRKAALPVTGNVHADTVMKNR